MRYSGRYISLLIPPICHNCLTYTAAIIMIMESKPIMGSIPITRQEQCLKMEGAEATSEFVSKKVSFL